jgi:hypothetical protein
MNVFIRRIGVTLDTIFKRCHIARQGVTDEIIRFVLS